MNVVSSQKTQWVLDHGQISICQIAEKWSATKHHQSTGTSHLRFGSNLTIERFLRNLARLKSDIQLSVSKVLEKTPNHHKVHWDLRGNWRSLRSNPLQIYRQSPGPGVPLKSWISLLKQIISAEQKPIKSGVFAIQPAVIAPLLPVNLKKLQSIQYKGNWTKVPSSRAWPIHRFEIEQMSDSPRFWAIHWNRDMVLARDLKEGGLVWLETGEIGDLFETMISIGPMQETFANQVYVQMPIMLGKSK